MADESELARIYAKGFGTGYIATLAGFGLAGYNPAQEIAGAIVALSGCSIMLGTMWYVVNRAFKEDRNTKDSGLENKVH